MKAVQNHSFQAYHSNAFVPFIRSCENMKNRYSGTDPDKILMLQSFIQLLRPDYYIIYKYAPFEIIYQENIRLDLGINQVSYNLIAKYSKPSELEHIRKMDHVIEQFSYECRIQPLDFICKVMSEIKCPNESLKKLMRTTFIVQCSEDGKPAIGIMSFHDITVLVNSIKPYNYNITFSPEKSELCHEAYKRLRKIMPKISAVTKRELEILQCLDEGLSSKEIASCLFISKTTVDTHRQKMLHKWNMPNTAALLRNAKSEGWI